MKRCKHMLLVLIAMGFIASGICVAFAAQRYSYISSFYSNGAIQATSASCQTQLVLNEAVPSKTVITLEKSTDGGKTYKYEAQLALKKSSQITYSTTGSKTGLNSRYSYRLKTEVIVYTSDGIVEVEYDCDYSY